MSTRLDVDSLSSLLSTTPLTAHFDAGETTNFARELLKIRAQVFEQRFPELKALRLVPKNGEVSDIDEQYAYRKVTEYGVVKLGSSYDQAAPRVGVSSSESAPVMIKPMVVSYGYSFQEAKVAAKTGSQLPARAANAARKAIAQELNRILTYGTSDYGTPMKGLLTLTGTTVYTVPNGVGGSKTWESKTADEILLDLNGMVTKIVVDTNDVEHPDTLILPLSSYELISTRRLGDGSDTTILKHFLATSPHIKQVEPWFACEQAPDAEWTGKRAMAYHKSPDVLEAIVPVEFDQYPPQVQNGMETVTTCHARTAGVVCYHPKAVCYADGI